MQSSAQSGKAGTVFQKRTNLMNFLGINKRKVRETSGDGPIEIQEEICDAGI
jgi:hypothetical protein